MSGSSATARRRDAEGLFLSGLMISTASRVGTGNIAGIAAAIAAGGPGAVFRMCLLALVNIAAVLILGNTVIGALKN